MGRVSSQRFPQNPKKWDKNNTHSRLPAEIRQDKRPHNDAADVLEESCQPGLPDSVGNTRRKVKPTLPETKTRKGYTAKKMLKEVLLAERIRYKGKDRDLPRERG